MSLRPDHHPDPDLAALREAWARGSGPPALAQFLTPELRSDPRRVLALLRCDAFERRHRGVPCSFDRILIELAASPEVIGPETPAAEFLLGLELGLDGGTPAEMKARVDAAYHALIDRLASRFLGDEATPSDGAATAALPARSPGAARASAGPWNAGDRIGASTLRRRLGSGAFGEVWLARQERPERDVAIKVLKPDVTDADSVRRFAVEAQVLAYLEHRYIARIYEAGTESGRPYIAMEYIEGKPLTRYCDDRRLSLEQRLELTARICEGVQHAHQRGLIHRDLKPDNILVTEIRRHPKDVEPSEDRLIVERGDDHVTIAVPKIVDFGLAKAIERSVRLPDGSLSVDLDRLMGTPEYMAPEQAGHQPLEVTQRSDIFSLGVILYELLAGTLPLTKAELRRRALDEMVAVLRGTPRPEPSTRFSQLDAATLERVSYQRGELSPEALGGRLGGRVRHLCGKALRLEPERRFSSVAALALDIRNYLDDRDFIEAAAEPSRERLLRHLRRHRLPYAAAAALIVALTAGVIGTAWQWRQARAANRGLTTASDATLRVTERLFDALRERGAIPAGDVAVLEEASADLRGVLPETDPTLLRIELLLAGVLKWAGRLDESDALYSSIGERLARSLPADDPDLLQVGFNRALVSTERGKLLDRRRRDARDDERNALLAEVNASYERALEALQALAQRASTLPVTHERRVEIDSEIALTLTRLRRFDDAIPAYRVALNGMRAALPSDHWRLADTSGGLGTALLQAGRATEAVEPFEESYRVYAGRPDRGPTHTSTLSVTARLATAQLQLQRCDEAWAAIRRHCDALAAVDRLAETAGLAALRETFDRVRATCDAPADFAVMAARLGLPIGE